MTGSRDVAAAEEAQLRALRDDADRRRAELGGTVRALADHAARDLEPRALARRTAEAAKVRVSGAARELAHKPAAAAKEGAYHASQGLARRPAAAALPATLVAVATAGAVMYWVIWRRGGGFPPYIRAGIRARNDHRRRGFLSRRGGDARRLPA